jgi:hypothetical protein
VVRHSTASLLVFRICRSTGLTLKIVSLWMHGFRRLAKVISQSLGKKPMSSTRLDGRLIFMKRLCNAVNHLTWGVSQTGGCQTEHCNLTRKFAGFYVTAVSLYGELLSYILRMCEYGLLVTSRQDVMRPMEYHLGKAGCLSPSGPHAYAFTLTLQMCRSLGRQG